MSESKPLNLEALGLDKDFEDHIINKIGMGTNAEVWWGTANGMRSNRRDFLWASWIDEKDNLKKMHRVDMI